MINSVGEEGITPFQLQLSEASRLGYFHCEGSTPEFGLSCNKVLPYVTDKSVLQDYKNVSDCVRRCGSVDFHKLREVLYEVGLLLLGSKELI